MKDGDGKNEITQQLIYDLRDRLLDTKTNNPLISFHFSDRSRTHIRVIDELPDVLYGKLALEKKTLTFASLSLLSQIPADEQTDSFRMAFEAARSSGWLLQNEIGRNCK